MNPLRSLAAAFSYFTILPAPVFSDAAGAAAIAWLPLVGVITGALAGLAGLGVYALTHVALWAVLAAWASGLILTGAIHVDGLLDAADGLFAAVPTQRRLDIMDDPRHGTYAIVTMAVVSAVWLASLARVEPAAMPLTLAIAGAISRFAGVAATAFPYVRTGRGRRLGAIELVQAALFIAVAYVQRFDILKLGEAVVVAAAATLLVAMWAQRRLGGGLTGDVYGAIVVVSEIAALMALTA